MTRADADSAFGRVDGLIDVSVLAGSQVVIIGAGTMGNCIADELCRHGVGRFFLVDGDRVELRNLIGTGYIRADVGKPKVESLASHLRAINPSVSVTYQAKYLTDEDVPRMADLAGRSDLVVLAADAFDLMLTIADACQDRCPIVMGSFGERADFGEVAFSLPEKTAPLRKTFGKRKRKAISKPQALGCDTRSIASFASALCIRLLLGDAKGSELFPCYANAPLYIQGLRRTWIFQDQPADLVRSVVCVGNPAS